MLKILIYILLALVLTVVLILLLKIRLRVRFDEMLTVTLSVLCFKIKLIPRKAKKEKSKAKTGKKNKDQKTVKTYAEKRSSDGTQKEKKKKKSPIKTLKLITSLAKTFLASFTRFLKIRVDELSIFVGGDDAAKVAIAYGEYTAAVNAFFAVTENFDNISVNEEKLGVCADFASQKTQAEIDVTFSMFCFQLLFCLIKTALEYIKISD